MRTLILSKILKMIIPLFLAFGIYMLFRGHNHPGGGFIAGMIVCIPFMVHIMAYGKKETARRYKLNPVFMVASGLLLVLLSGLISLPAGKSFLTAVWSDDYIPLLGKLGTPIMFDIGVFFTVSGVVLKISFLLSEE